MQFLASTEKENSAQKYYEIYQIQRRAVHVGYFTGTVQLTSAIDCFRFLLLLQNCQ